MISVLSQLTNTFHDNDELVSININLSPIGGRLVAPD